jgi:hypothetical protein
MRTKKKPTAVDAIEAVHLAQLSPGSTKVRARALAYLAALEGAERIAFDRHLLTLDAIPFAPLGSIAGKQPLTVRRAAARGRGRMPLASAHSSPRSLI